MSTSTERPINQVLGQATYKGRVYPIIFVGTYTFDGRETKRAKLAFTDFTKTFWVSKTELDNYELYPQSVDRDEWQPPKTDRRSNQHVDAEPTPDVPSYCTHCGQQIN
jgi:hypothetical protein